jgi:pimeloyl-ACP methyl ester carboxylesterase
VISLVRCRSQTVYDVSMHTSRQNNLGAGPSEAASSTIVLIHGLWLTPRSWERWIERYADLGYRVLAPSWPGMESEVEGLKANPSALASLTVEHIVDHYESIIIEFECPPIVMGHSFGGTFTQILLDQGLGAAGVAVASATLDGTRDIPLTAVNVASPAFGRFQRREPVLLTAQEFHYAFANTVSREESNALYARYAVPAPGGLLTEHAFANFRRAASLRVAVDREARAPLLFIGFGEDHLMPTKLVRPDRKMNDSSSVTEFVEFPGRPHLPGAPGWEDVADYALSWAVEHAHQSTACDDARTRQEEKGGSS